MQAGLAYRLLGLYTARTKPTDLTVMQPSRLELVINFTNPRHLTDATRVCFHSRPRRPRPRAIYVRKGGIGRKGANRRHA